MKSLILRKWNFLRDYACKYLSKDIGYIKIQMLNEWPYGTLYMLPVLPFGLLKNEWVSDVFDDAIKEFHPCCICKAPASKLGAVSFSTSYVNVRPNSPQRIRDLHWNNTSVMAILHPAPFGIEYDLPLLDRLSHFNRDDGEPMVEATGLAYFCDDHYYSID